MTSTIDKSWMAIRDRCDPAYSAGVNEFLDFAFKHVTSNSRTYCPCRKCHNGQLKTREEIREDLIVTGMSKTYTFWDFHGEEGEPIVDIDSGEEENEVDDGMEGLVADTFAGIDTSQFVEEEMVGGEDNRGMPDEDAQRIYRVLRNAKTCVYPGCKLSILHFILKLMHIKCIGGMSNKAFSMLLELLKSAFPEGEKLPKSHYEAKKILQDLGHSYNKIDACVNDCVLFRKELADAKFCPTCGESRWKTKDNESNDVDAEFSADHEKRIPRKILRHFPLKPRLKKLFMSSKTATDMQWHHDKRIRDGILRHPADSEAWQHVDRLYPEFSKEPRNVRLGLASDGFNPFSTMSLSYSIWPVILFPYNLPPWVCMKQTNMILSLIIPGERAPGNDIDVYLQPLIDELKELWVEGVETYDSSKNSMFQMKAVLLWTISDFPGYANLSGWSTKGKLACPVCNVETSSRRLENGRKECYMCHRRFLPSNHKWRRNITDFDGSKEPRPPPMLLTGCDIVEKLNSMDKVIFGKRKKKTGPKENHNWKKKSIFYELSYWKMLLIRHNLDVMHIEKNICDNVIGTLLGVAGKSKDNLNSRLDLQKMNIRKTLHPIQQDGDKYLIPAAPYTLSSSQKTLLLQFLKDIKVPDGFSSNISRCVNIKEKKLVGLKSHDCHVLLQRFLPLVIRGLLEPEVCDALIGISSFFLELCSKVLRVDDLERLDRDIAVTLCRLEMLFLPSFFDVMVHLSIHLASEARVAGPVQFRWMYAIERYLHTLKSYVRNKSRPEGSIAEGYILEECLTFCSRYFADIETTFNRVPRYFDGIDIHDQHEGVFNVFISKGRALGKSCPRKLSDQEWNQAHLYVLQNCDEVHPFIEEHKEILRTSCARNIDLLHREKFPKWFESRVHELSMTTSNFCSEQLRHLSNGPDEMVSSWRGYVVNGYKFQTEERDARLKTQNSGVVVNGENGVANLNYYGTVINVIELRYLGGRRVVLFECDWRDVHSQGRGIDIDKYGFVSVNPERRLRPAEPFVLAYQCEQVFYVSDNEKSGWRVVVKVQPRDFYDVIEKDDDPMVDANEATQLNASADTSIPRVPINDEDNILICCRDLPMETVSISKTTSNRRKRK